MIGIVFEAYSPLGNPGRLTKGDDDPNVLSDSELAVRHNVGPAQVCYKVTITIYNVTIVYMYQSLYSTDI